MRKVNRILQSDSYKMTHPGQYPPNTEYVSSYGESRGGLYPVTMMTGMTGMLKDHFEGIQIEEWMIQDAKEFVDAHIGPGLFELEGWQHIYDTYQGMLPLEIKAVPEGSVVPTRNVLYDVINTDPKVPWLTNWAETTISRLWLPITVATNSLAIKDYISSKLLEAGDTLDGLNFMLHDFGARGVSSAETAEIAGAAHLAAGWLGSDNMEAIMYIKDTYDFDGMPAFSVSASEHSTVTSWGREGEDDAIRNMFKIYPKGIVSMVADSYNVYEFVERIGTIHKAAVLRRDGVTVVRPDSGDPRIILPKLLNILWKHFHGTLTDKGYKILDPKIRVLQGDGIDAKSIEEIVRAIMHAGFSPSNLVFGSGGGLLQKFDRDTQKFAIKCSAIGVRVDGSHGSELDWRPVFKDPITSKMKKSKKGRMVLHKTGDTYMTITEGDAGSNYIQYTNELKLVFRNGEMFNIPKWEDIAKIREPKLVFDKIN